MDRAVRRAKALTVRQKGRRPPLHLELFIKQQDPSIQEVAFAAKTNYCAVKLILELVTLHMVQSPLRASTSGHQRHCVYFLLFTEFILSATALHCNNRQTMYYIFRYTLNVSKQDQPKVAVLSE